MLALEHKSAQPNGRLSMPRFVPPERHPLAATGRGRVSSWQRLRSRRQRLLGPNLAGSSLDCSRGGRVRRW